MRPAMDRSCSVISTLPELSPKGAESTATVWFPIRGVDSRTPDFQTPTVDGDTLTMKWRVTYTKAGRPDLVISGVETAIFEGDRIALLRDTFDPEAQKAMEQWMAQHGAALQGG